MTDPYDDSIHGLSGPYALDALDDEERVRFEEHLSRCSVCRAEVDGLREAAVAMAAGTEAEPPPGLRERVLAGVDTVRPLPPITRARPADPPPSPARGWLARSSGRLLVAAAAVVLAVVGATVWRPWEDPDRSAPTAAERVLEAQDAERTAQRFPDGSTATVVVSRSEGRAVLLTEDMPLAPAGKVYQLWLLPRGGDMEPAGLMPDDPDATVVLAGDASDATAVGITVEPDGGSPEPTSEPIAVFEL